MGNQCARHDTVVDVNGMTAAEKERRDSCHSVSDDSVRLQNLLNLKADCEGGGTEQEEKEEEEEEGEKEAASSRRSSTASVEEASGSGKAVDSTSSQQTAAAAAADEGVARSVSSKKASDSFSRKPIKMPSSKGRAGTSTTDNDADVSHPAVNKDLPPRIDGTAPKDLMISYSHADKEMMLRVREKLEQNGITVWVDVSGLKAGVDFLSKIGEAIIDAKLFISLLSVNCVQSRYCQDELALAYVSDTAIFPLAIEDPANFKSKMDTGMKLQLARYDWTILEEKKFDEQMAVLIDLMKSELKIRAKEKEEREKKEAEKEKDSSTKRPMTRAKSRTQLRHQRKTETELTPRADEEGVSMMPDKFWRDNFKAADVVDADQFEKALFEKYLEQIAEYFDEANQEWLKTILRREMEVEEDGKLYKYNYDAFCMIEGEPKPLWDRVLNQAMESYAMKDVFNMESTVRVEAIENLGKFRSAAVIDALRDLLSDADANVRAVASVSLARTEANDPVTLKFLSKTLNDKDRLVREAGCLALGHLQARQAVSKLLHLWRNDVISHVREAARVALHQIGGPEVEKAMHVTKVLADEIRQLTTQ